MLEPFSQLIDSSPITSREVSTRLSESFIGNEGYMDLYLTSTWAFRSVRDGFKVELQWRDYTLWSSLPSISKNLWVFPLHEIYAPHGREPGWSLLRSFSKGQTIEKSRVKQRSAEVLELDSYRALEEASHHRKRDAFSVIKRAIGECFPEMNGVS